MRLRKAMLRFPGEKMAPAFIGYNRTAGAHKGCARKPANAFGLPSCQSLITSAPATGHTLQSFAV